MENNLVIPQNIKKYVKRLIIEYKNQNNDLFNILSRGEIKIDFHYEDFQHYYHRILCLLPEECFENNLTPLAKEKQLADKLTTDLNQIISVPDESISEVVFELQDNKIDFDSYLKNKIAVNPAKLDFWDKDCLRVFISYSDKEYEIANELKK